MKYLRLGGIIVLSIFCTYDVYDTVHSIPAVTSGIVGWYEVLIGYFILSMPFQLGLLTVSTLAFMFDEGWRKYIAVVGFVLSGIGICLATVELLLGAVHYFS
jgi:hypothetical protein